MLEFMEYISAKVDVSQPVDIIYLDFQKAFDKVPHQRLLVKLEVLGIQGQILAWMKAWLNNTQQRVVINGKGSDWLDVTSEFHRDQY